MLLSGDYSACKLYGAVASVHCYLCPAPSWVESLFQQQYPLVFPLHLHRGTSHHPRHVLKDVTGPGAVVRWQELASPPDHVQWSLPETYTRFNTTFWCDLTCSTFCYQPDFKAVVLLPGVHAPSRRARHNRYFLMIVTRINTLYPLHSENDYSVVEKKWFNP